MANSIIYGEKPLIWPLPNKCEWKDGYLPFDKTVTVYSDACFTDEAGLFADYLKDEGLAASCGDAGSIVKVVETTELIDEEGYLLDISAAGITIKANSNSGAFYGLQSLIQLISNSTDRKIPFASIADYPFKRVRGLHFYVPPRKDIPWFKRFIDFLAKYKLNTIYLEVGAALKFDTHPEINEAWESFCKEMLVYPGGPDSNGWADSGMQVMTGIIKNSVHIENGGGSYLEKEEFADLVDYIKKRHIDIVPEVQSLSHSYWMLLAHKECAEVADDIYPDTYCPSNPRSYEILFDCMQEIVDIIKPKTVSLGHDELHYIGSCDRCKDKTGHDLLAEDILKLHGWLKERGIRTYVWGDKFLDIIKADEREKGMPVGGPEYFLFNQREKRNNITKATYRSLDMMPSDLIIGDWYYTMTAGEDTGSQDEFFRRGLDVVFGNFHPAGFPNVEDRLRRPNVTGAECSLWHETSELGMAMTNGLVRYLDTSNLLWYEGYKYRMRGELNRAIAQIYPAERDKMNGVASCALDSKGFEFIDISGHYNVPLNWAGDYSFIKTSGSIPNTIPFDACRNVADTERDAACVLVGHGMDECVDGIEIGGSFRAIAFLHSYSIHLGGPPAHACSYVGPEKDIVGFYRIEYGDGSSERVALEYSRNLISVKHEFGAHYANPVYQEAVLSEEITKGKTSKKLSLKMAGHVVFSYEWRNPRPEKEISSISIEHAPEKEGGIVLLAVTGIK